jgi:hypothetical protein
MIRLFYLKKIIRERQRRRLQRENLNPLGAFL